MNIALGSRLRILHVVGSLTRGGVENWLMHVLRHIDRKRFEFDFLVHTEVPAAYDDAARALGSTIIPCLDHLRPWRYARNFAAAVRSRKPYQIIHSHVHQFSGYVLWLAEKAGIPGRIVHSHLDTSYEDQTAALPRKVYLRTMRSCIKTYATCGLAASGKSATALYGPFWQRDPRWRILYYGINLEPYQQLSDRYVLRDRLGLPSDAFVIGHVGIFKKQKNHSFLLRVATEVLLRSPRAYVVLVGDGPLRPEIEAAAKQAGIQDRVLFTGARDDVPNLLAIMDVFLFPSLWEGLPLALLEALAAGLPCVVSNAVTDEGDVVPQLVQRMSLSDPVSMWADTVLAWRTTPLPISQAEACALVSESAFSSSTSTKTLTELYESLLS